MDQATRRARAKMKAQRKLAKEQGNSISLVEARGLGKKGKRHETFPTKCCDYRIGGRQVPVKRARKEPLPNGKPDYYTIMCVVGGVNCHRPALHKGRCLEHQAATYGADNE